MLTDNVIKAGHFDLTWSFYILSLFMLVILVPSYLVSWIKKFVPLLD